MPPSSTPCAACKCLRRKCMAGVCIFAPYFPHDNPAKFNSVHKIYGAGNVGKLLRELSPDQREDAVNSLVYEAEFRLRDPVHGSLGLIMMLQKRLKDVEKDLENVKKELATYVGSAAMHPEMMQQPPNDGPLAQHQPMVSNFQAMMGLSTRAPQGARLVIREPQQQQYQHHQQQQ